MPENPVTLAPRRRAPWQDAYDAQMALWRWYRTPIGRAWAEENYRSNRTSFDYEETGNLLAEMWEGELTRLIDCDPICVSTEMCDLVEAAATSFQPEALLETDLVTPRGFMFFEHPFEVPDRFDEPTTIQAVSWARIFALPDDPDAAKKVRETIAQAEMTSPGSNEREEVETMVADAGAIARGITLTIYCASPENRLPGIPAVVPMHLTPWYFGMSFEGNEIDADGKPTGAEWWWKIVQTTFRLMQQKIAVRHQERPDRSARREANRLRFPDEQTVVVVRLRREKGEPHDSPSESANYSHRFIVSGHWRDQWYPSIQGHRQIWISPFVKGDPGLPLIVKPRRVFQWNR